MENVNKQLFDALKRLLECYKMADHRDGYCCCGSPMDRHGDPMNCGHSAVDAGEYNASLIIEDVESAIAAAEQAQADDAEAEWRRLALQFDGHRLQALAHLRCLLENPESHAEAVRAFLAAPPLSGEQVLANRIAEQAQQAEPVAHDDDMVLIPRGLVGAACSAIDKKRDAQKVLALQRDVAMSKAAQPPAVAVPGAVDLLREMEWQHRPHDDHWHTTAGFYCPECLESQKVGHAADCKLAAVLAAAQKGGAA